MNIIFVINIITIISNYDIITTMFILIRLVLLLLLLVLLLLYCYYYVYYVYMYAYIYIYINSADRKTCLSNSTINVHKFKFRCICDQNMFTTSRFSPNVFVEFNSWRCVPSRVNFRTRQCQNVNDRTITKQQEVTTCFCVYMYVCMYV